jgi:hypothetical protein
MALEDAVLDTAVDAVTAELTWISLHSDDPGGDGSNETSDDRLMATWGSSSGGVAGITNDPLSFEGPGSGPITHVGAWSSDVGGVWKGSTPIIGDTAFNANGDFDLTALTVTATSSD